MSRSDPSCRLCAISEDDAVKITIFDENLSPVAQGIRVLELDLSPGLYDVRFEAGSSVREQFVSLMEGSGTVVVKQEQIAFSSAAPLLNTQEEISEQSHAAARVSERVHRSLGKG